MHAAASLYAIYLGQWKALKAYTADDDTPGKISIVGAFMVYALPCCTVIATFMFGLNIDSSDTLLSMLGILAGALIAAVGQLAAWRESICKENPKDDDAHRPERWLLDSSVSHILAGAYSAIFAVILTIVGMIVTLPDTPAIPEWSHHVCTALILLFSSHVATSVLVSLPALYSAYVQVNEVPPALNGNDSTH